mmetsp:Transcript_18950/g.24384  ORF Transcript_18950/g.24384 Transcript_18950/m.24384 type:complete len:446 (+) Transcript_18950:221-1558(+)|eukprot:CAMPEP_0198147920 /NCGR_PEP_ID=MMETSP1443-20131203/38541_1 /TAXON_ID=186043 /ORGANISM="Entomoneis sp., Strain CCMP2396" /LENGTH=445 /DNA_ID=CAMNT_0043812441 /DNA_START=117 /DNA_END=1454 /DNA_ORIENTATION=+
MTPFTRWTWLFSSLCFLDLSRAFLPLSLVTRSSSKSSTSSISRYHEQLQKNVGKLFATNQDGGMGGAGDLISTLARADKAWKIQQRSKSRSRWTKLILNDDDDDDNDDKEKKTEENMADAPSATMPLENTQEFVYLLEPPNLMNPSCLIVFVGGAGLGTFPQVAYQEFLMRISNKMNAAIITAPYPIGMDHFQLAKQLGERTRKAMLQCEEDPQRLYSPNLPVYCLAHSLGCKLASIYAAATGQEYDGMGFVGFNNFGFGSTIGMAKEFAQTIQNEYGASGRFGGVEVPKDTLNGIFDVAQTFIGNIGLEFTPSPEDTERLISMKFDEKRVSKTRLFVMDEDNLDDSPSFIRACEGKPPLEISALPGDHLTPVYFKLDLDDIDIPKEARDIARENLGGFESASFGNNENLDTLVNEVCGFLLGKEPSRRPVQSLLAASGPDEEPK